ncbi:Hypothetical protein Bdt_2086 [Bdellovibrio bacteriovorus str. Tiberius]|uniref:Cell surface protein n=2 Tax=Bdellovibrio bacteriovorus TaxID=959 RepID=K7ZFS0_BDEBC|nr:Hypothetical protein Bdt_2086 [Bdellovibrio bacteriovorus str. Tiberius]
MIGFFILLSLLTSGCSLNAEFFGELKEAIGIDPGTGDGGSEGDSGTLTNLSNYKIIVNGPMKAAASVDDNIFIGGSFNNATNIASHGLKISYANGTPSLSSVGLGGYAGDIFANAVDAAGNIYVYGRFYKSITDSASEINVLKFRPDLTLDNSFPVLKLTWSSTSYSAHDLHGMIVKNNRLYVSGVFEAVNGVERVGAFSVDLATGQLTSWNPTFVGGAEIIQDDASTVTFRKAGSYHGNPKKGYYFLNKAGQATTLFSTKSWDPTVSSRKLYVDRSQTRVYEGITYYNRLVLRKLTSSYVDDPAVADIELQNVLVESVQVLKDYVVVMVFDNAVFDTTKEYYFKVYSHAGAHLYDTPVMTVTVPNASLLPRKILQVNEQNSLFFAGDYPMDVTAFDGPGKNIVRDLPVAEFQFSAAASLVTSFYPTEIVPGINSFQSIQYESGQLSLIHFNGAYTYDTQNGNAFLGSVNQTFGNSSVSMVGDYLFIYNWHPGVRQLEVYNKLTGAAVTGVISPAANVTILPAYGEYPQFTSWQGELFAYYPVSAKLLVFDLNGNITTLDTPVNSGAFCSEYIVSSAGICFSGTNYGGVFDGGLYTVNTANDTLVPPTAITQAVFASGVRHVFGYARNAKYEAFMHGDTDDGRLVIYDVTNSSVVWERFINTSNAETRLILSGDILYMTGSSVLADPAVFNSGNSAHNCPSFPASCKVINSFVSINAPAQSIVQDFGGNGANYSHDLINHWKTYRMYRFQDKVIVPSGDDDGFDAALPEKIYMHVYDAATGTDAGKFSDLYFKFQPRATFFGHAKPIEQANGDIVFYLSSLYFNDQAVSPLLKVSNADKSLSFVDFDGEILGLADVDGKLLVVQKNGTQLNSHPLTSSVVVFDPGSGDVTNVPVPGVVDFVASSKARILKSGSQLYIAATGGIQSFALVNGQLQSDRYALISGTMATGSLDAVLNDGQMFLIGNFESLKIVDATDLSETAVNFVAGSNFVRIKNAADLFTKGQDSLSAIPGLVSEPFMAMLNLKMSITSSGDSVYIGGISTANGVATSLARYKVAQETFDAGFVHSVSLTIANVMVIPNLIAAVREVSSGKLLLEGVFSTLNGQAVSTLPVLNVADGAVTDSILLPSDLVAELPGELERTSSGNMVLGRCAANPCTASQISIQ